MQNDLCTIIGESIIDRAPVKLVTKPTADKEARSSAIELLKETLADAEAGKVCGCIIVTKENDGTWMHRATPSLSIREEIGAIESLKWDRLYRTNNRD